MINSFSLIGPLPGAQPVATVSRALVKTWQELHSNMLYLPEAEPGPDERTVYRHLLYCVNNRTIQREYAENVLARLENKPIQSPVMLAWQLVQLDAWSAATAQRIDKLLSEADVVMCQSIRDMNALDHEGFIAIIKYCSLRFAGKQVSAQLRERVTNWLARNAAASRPPALGLAGGQASELLLLLRLRRLGFWTDNFQETIRERILHLLSVRQEVDFQSGKYSFFPFYSGTGIAEAAFSAELSWRHGDLAQAWLLYDTQALLQDAELAKIAALVGLNTLLRTTPQMTGITSSQFDQGAAGVATLYRKLYRVSGNPAYLKGYHFWLDQTLMLVKEEIAAGKHQRPGTMREGLLGVGTVLLSAMTEQELGWETLLL